MIAYRYNVFLGLRGRETEVAVRTARVIVPGESLAGEMRDVDDGIQRGANPAAVKLHLEDLAFVGFEPEAVDVAGLGDDAVEGPGSGCRGGLGVVIVGLDLQRISVFAEAKDVPGG